MLSRKINEFRLYESIASSSALNVFANSPFKTSTSISGRYSLKDVPSPNYVIYSSYQDNFNEGIFLVNKEIKEDGAVDLEVMQTFLR